MDLRVIKGFDQADGVPTALKSNEWQQPEAQKKKNCDRDGVSVIALMQYMFTSELYSLNGLKTEDQDKT